MRRVWGLAAALILLGGAAGFAQPIVFAGQTSAFSPTFNRPDEGGGLSGVQARFQAQPFSLPANSTCHFESGQTYDGYLHLYRDPFNPAAPLVNHIASDDDDPNGSVFTRGSELAGRVLTAGNYVLVHSSFAAGVTGDFLAIVRCGSTQPITAPCNGYTIQGIPAANTTCLANRFIVAIDFVSGPAPGGLGTPVRMGTTDTAYFWFYNSANTEAMVKVIDGCGFNNRWWVYGAFSTDQQYRLLIGDTHFPGLGLKSYFHAAGTPAPALTDSNAWNTCP